MIVVTNLLPGTYRIAIHERGNCSSPNGFSAGPAVGAARDAPVSRRTAAD